MLQNHSNISKKKLKVNYDSTRLFFKNKLSETEYGLIKSSNRKLSDKAKKMNRIVQVGHLERYNPVIVTLKSFLEKAGTEDEIMHITGRRVGPGPTKLDSKVLDPNYYGAGHDFMVHDVDVVNGLIGKIPKRVTATSAYIEGFPYEVELFAVFEIFIGSLHT